VRLTAKNIKIRIIKWQPTASCSWQSIASSDSNGKRKLKNNNQLAKKAASVVSALAQ